MSLVGRSVLWVVGVLVGLTRWLVVVLEVEELVGRSGV